MNPHPLPIPDDGAAAAFASAAESADPVTGFNSPLCVERIESTEAFAALEPEWGRLFVESGANQPFATYEWAAAWWRRLRRDSALVRDSLCFRAVRDNGRRLVAVAPFIRTERPATGPMRSVSLQFLGADPNITELRGILCRPEIERAVCAALLTDLNAENVGGHAWDWIRWNGLRSSGESGGGSEFVLAQPACRALPPTPVSLLDLAPTWEEFRAGLKRNIRESLRKCYNSLRRDNYPFAVTVCETAADIHDALERFFPLHRSRAEMAGGVAHPDVFSHPDGQRFLHDVCTVLAQGGAAKPYIFELKIAERLVASRIAFGIGDTLYFYYSGFDPIWARYSVMTTLVAEMIRWAIESGLHTVNLSTGIDVSKSRWGPRVVSYGNAIQFAPGARAGLAYRAYEVGNSLKAHLDR